LGRYFTPRNVIDSMIEMSDIDKLEEGSKICDPACGVGGFILEPMKVKNNTEFYYPIKTGRIKPRLNFSGFDKGFETDEQLTIILAKANMLLFLSELLKTNSELIGDFSTLLNDTFKLTVNSIMGTLENIEKDKYDLILTNPPYVTSGSSNYKERIKKDAELKKFYKINAMGVEGLFLEWIIRSLRPSKKAFVVIPDGILNRSKGDNLRKFIKDQCYIDGIISLPVNTFYTTPKKTYILALTKKSDDTDEKREKIQQTESIFTYLVSDVGETLDINRFKTDKNDLKEMVCLFKQFVAVKDSFISTNLKCKIFDIEKFNPESSWSVDRWWSKEEKIDLGIEDEETILSLDEFIQKSKDVETKIHEFNTQLEMLQ
jgi:type I restriction enzyme M protein